MIVLREPGAKILKEHRLEHLSAICHHIYPEPEYSWNVPFTVQVIGGTQAEREKVIEEAIKRRPLDQVFRYPTDNKGQPWDLVENLDFDWFLRYTVQICSDMDRIKRCSSHGQ
jgi:hypothetical protein